jgi:hypothetical protein
MTDWQHAFHVARTMSRRAIIDHSADVAALVALFCAFWWGTP